MMDVLAEIEQRYSCVSSVTSFEAMLLYIIQEHISRSIANDVSSRLRGAGTSCVVDEYAEMHLHV
jgi:hypothetical protein